MGTVILERDVEVYNWENEMAHDLYYRLCCPGYDGWGFDVKTKMTCNEFMNEVKRKEN